MNKKTIIYLLTIIANLSSVEAESLSVSGSISLHNQAYESLNISGNLNANKIIVSGSTAVSGSVAISDSTVSSLYISGNTRLNNSKVKGQVSISGKASIIRSDIFGNQLSCSGGIDSSNNNYNIPMSISGSLDTKHDTFNNEVNASGNLMASGSVFHKTVTSSSTITKLDNTTLDENLINTSNYKKPIITLTNTQIRGKIIFTKTPGIVIMDAKSKIMDKVVNGEINMAPNATITK